MNPVIADELRRDFIRSRKNYDLFGWPTHPPYYPEDLDYLRMLELERIAGRIEIQGKIVTIEEYESIL